MPLGERFAVCALCPAERATAAAVLCGLSHDGGTVYGGSAAALVVVAAGPVRDGRTVRLGNAGLRLDLRQAGQHFCLRYCLVVNDLRAKACAALTAAGDSARHLGRARTHHRDSARGGCRKVSS